ncbi:MAG TPA: Gfo/Idh/MocA family oxidoreductase [Mycobacteriales bacterium]|nr:Gfo/Idh/MocA family oxidoreductase [Mycobacteriales bacterium]
MRFAIVGAGVIGTLHAKLLDSLDGSELVAVVDVELDRARELANGRGADATDDLGQILGRDDVDAVSVCVPSGTHAEIAVAALDAGKPVIIEKPIDVTLEAADRIIAAEKRSGAVATVISQRRFQPSFAFVRSQIEAGRLGQITSGIAESPFWRSQSYYDSGGWRGTWKLDGGGALMNQGVHALDLLVWMLGEPVEATAFTATLVHERIEVEDTLGATVRFANGAIGTVTATTASNPGRTVRLTINGDAGNAVVDNERLAHLHTLDRESEGAADQVDLVPELREPSDPMSTHAAQYADFIAAVAEGRPPAITTADGRRALALVLAIYESAAAGGKPTLVR